MGPGVFAGHLPSFPFARAPISLLALPSLLVPPSTPKPSAEGRRHRALPLPPINLSGFSILRRFTNHCKSELWRNPKCQQILKPSPKSHKVDEHYTTRKILPIIEGEELIFVGFQTECKIGSSAETK